MKDDGGMQGVRGEVEGRSRGRREGKGRRKEEEGGGRRNSDPLLVRDCVDLRRV